MKKILYLTYYLREDTLTAGHRSYNNCKYLPGNDYSIDVITSKSLTNQLNVKKEYLVSGLSERVRMFKLYPAFYEWFIRKLFKQGYAGTKKILKRHRLSGYLWPDWAFDWGLRALFIGLILARKNKYDVIITNSLPYTSHLIGYLLHKILKKPWIVELRDGWIMDPEFIQSLTYFHLALHEKFVKLVVKSCDLMWHLTPRLCRFYQDKYPAYAKKMFSFPLGYDEKIDQQPEERKRNNVLEIIYVGNFYQFASPPELFLEPLSELLRQQPNIRMFIRVNIVGNNHRYVAEKAASFGLMDVVHFFPPMPYKELNVFIHSNDLALIINFGSPYCRARYSSKLFDYILAKKPILALVEKGGLIEEVISQTGLGWTIYARDKEKIKILLLDLYNKIKSNDFKITPNLQEIEKYSLQKSIIPGMKAEINRIIENTGNKSGLEK